MTMKIDDEHSAQQAFEIAGMLRHYAAACVKLSDNAEMSKKKYPDADKELEEFQKGLDDVVQDLMWYARAYEKLYGHWKGQE